MGAWGPGLFSDDVACEVKEYYMNCLREEMTADEAEAAVAEYFRDELADDDDRSVVVLALADTAWRMGRLSDNLKNAAIKIIDNGYGLDRWKAEGATLLKKRQNVLLKLKEKILSTQPPEKIFHKQNPYICPWKIGDVFAYRLESKFAKEKGYNGRYLIIQKVDENILGSVGHIVPMVYFRISRDNKLPTIEEVCNIECIKVCHGESSENVFRYRGMLLCSSKRNIPKSLIYIGNTNIIFPKLEETSEIYANFIYFNWKNIDEWIIERYEKFN